MCIAHGIYKIIGAMEKGWHSVDGKKFMCADVGLRCYVHNKRQASHTAYLTDLSKLFFSFRKTETSHCFVYRASSSVWLGFCFLWCLYDRMCLMKTNDTVIQCAQCSDFANLSKNSGKFWWQSKYNCAVHTKKKNQNKPLNFLAIHSTRTHFFFFNQITTVQRNRNGNDLVDEEKKI